METEKIHAAAQTIHDARRKSTTGEGPRPFNSKEICTIAATLGRACSYRDWMKVSRALREIEGSQQEVRRCGDQIVVVPDIGDNVFHGAYGQGTVIRKNSVTVTIETGRDVFQVFAGDLKIL